MGTLIGGRKVYFEYGHKPVHFQSHGEEKIEHRPSIKCVIAEVKDGKENVVAEATVTPHHTERQNKYVGRFYAFKKATQNINDKGLKKELFNDFLGKLRVH